MFKVDNIILLWRVVISRDQTTYTNFALIPDFLTQLFTGNTRIDSIVYFVRGEDCWRLYSAPLKVDNDIRLLNTTLSGKQNN